MSSSTDSVRHGEKIIRLLSRGIINETEMTGQLIQTVLLSRDLELQNVPECLALIPPGVCDALREFMQSGPRSGADWEKLPRQLIGGDEESERLAREQMKKNARILRQHFGLNQ